MKTFKDLKIGDELYFIDGDFSVKSCKIDGIRNIGLENTNIEIFRVGRKDPIPVDAHGTKCTISVQQSISISYYSCFEAAKETQDKIRKEYIDEQFRIAKQAFSRIKKILPNNDSLKKRIFDFFNIK